MGGMGDLRFGSSGANVRLLQAGLNTRSAYYRTKYGGFPQIKVDGELGPDTAAAIQRVGRALGVTESDLTVVARSGLVSQELLRVIRHPQSRTPAQLVRAADRWRRARKVREAGRPKAIVTAAQLGLQFQWVFGPLGTPWRSTGHYTAGERAKDLEEGIKVARQVHAQHVAQGWGGCSYFWMIPDDGSLLCLNPIGRKSAHVAGNNSGNVAFNCPGTTGDEPTQAQIATFRWLLANAHTRKMPRAHRSPVDLRTLPRYVHSDLNPTGCPGSYKPMYKEA